MEMGGMKCGYCKQETTRFTNGMWGHVLTTRDYQDLIDRGWRRCGHYCYKPINSKCCCPAYPIKCHALDFRISKSQKKVLRKFKNYIETGNKCNVGKIKVKIDTENFEIPLETRKMEVTENLVPLDSIPKDHLLSLNQNNPHDIETNQNVSSKNNVTKKKDTVCAKPKTPATVKEGGQIKAKIMRRERWGQKQLAKGLSGELQTNRGTQAKRLEEWLTYKTDSTHQFEIRIVLANPKHEAFQESFEESLSVYQKYQVSIHGDTIDKCDARNFKRFLCNNPLKQDGVYGAYHRQYILNGKIIAVGVIDILPYCVSSVYLYYDPDYSFLSLGTYTSLSEIAFVRYLQKRYRDMKYYYLGFYIHSCPKMRYKGEFSPSFLCCPESFTWQPINQCLPLLDSSAYSRLCPNEEKKDENAFKCIKEVMVLHQRKMMTWSEYEEFSSRSIDEDSFDIEEEKQQEIREVTEYGHLVGRVTIANMLLFRPTKDC